MFLERIEQRASGYERRRPSLPRWYRCGAILKTLYGRSPRSRKEQLKPVSNANACFLDVEGMLGLFL